MKFYRTVINGIEVFTGEAAHIKFEIVPAAGGKILSIYNKDLQKEFLWRNQGLTIQAYPPGTDYDTNFFGGIDELLPNDMSETVDSIDYPDHGELWTTQLDYEMQGNKISVFGNLRLSGLYYKKTIRLSEKEPELFLDYTIRNDSGGERSFLWKMHAALAIEPGDQLITSAKKAKLADPGYSRFTDLNEFSWPMVQSTNASMVPGNNGSTDFFYLYEVVDPEMKMIMGDGKNSFSYCYDKNVFPFQWYFASYGGFLNHYVAVLEPCSSMPMSIREAAEKKQCTVLKPGQHITTTVQIRAGKNI